MLVQTKLWLQEPDSGSYGNFAVSYRLSALYAVKAFLGRKKKSHWCLFCSSINCQMCHGVCKKVLHVQIRGRWAYILDSFSLLSWLKINKSLLGKDRALIRLELETLREVFVNISRCGGIPLM